MALVNRRSVATALGIVSLAIRLLAGGAPTEQAGAAVQPPTVRGVEARAVTYLAAEVPRWRREHACYSATTTDMMAALLSSPAALRSELSIVNTVF